MPDYPGFDINVIPIKGKLLISTGRSKSIIEYNIDKNTYSCIAAGLEIAHNNVFIKDNDIVFLLSTVSYTSYTDNIGLWEQSVNPINFTYRVVCKPVKRDKMIFFFSLDHEIIQFNLDTFELRLLSIIT